MKSKISQMVIDADVAFNAGITEQPLSKNSREILQAILNDSNVNVVFCKELLNEWNKHQSRFSYGWRASMVSKKRTVFVKIADNFITALDEITHLTSNEMKAIRKDAHLIETALKSENFIISNDNISRNICCKIVDSYKELKNLCWAVPLHDSELLIKFIKDGGYLPKQFKIKQ
jgi:hypothetical protein